MDQIQRYLPSGEKGLLPYYLFIVSTVAMGNAVQNFVTLHYTRRIYDGQFVPSSKLPPKTATYNPEDSVHKLAPVSPNSKDAEKAKDQVTPLAARLFATYTFIAGLIRLYACYRLDDPAMYQMSMATHLIAGLHFASEILVYKTIKWSGPEIFPLVLGFGGFLWMCLQYNHYLA
ncbi:hypothetical protein GQ53DRAFT_755257 [Thozetella sp. PMI_491]|nr:hypothetical protein GQ53DRAFT_755257 [Thozetella sp. PMI_491]